MNRIGKKNPKALTLQSTTTQTKTQTKIKKTRSTTKTNHTRHNNKPINNTLTHSHRLFASENTYGAVTEGVKNNPPKSEIDDYAKRAVESFGPQQSSGPLASISRYNKVNPDTQIVKCMTPLEHMALAETCGKASYDLDGGCGLTLKGQGPESLSELHVSRPQSTFNHDACPPRVMNKGESEPSGQRKFSQSRSSNNTEQQHQHNKTSSSRHFSTSMSSFSTILGQSGLGLMRSDSTQPQQRPMDFSRSELKFQTKHRFSTRGQRMRFATDNRHGHHNESQSPSTTSSSSTTTQAGMTDKIDQSKRQMKSGVRDFAEKAKDVIDSGTKSWTEAIEKTSVAATTAAEKFHQVSETVKTSAEDLKHKQEKLSHEWEAKRGEVEKDFKRTENVVDATVKQAKASFSRAKEEIETTFNKTAQQEGLPTPSSSPASSSASSSASQHSSSGPSTGASSGSNHKM